MTFWHSISCSGKVRKYGRKHDGIQQYRCTKCGRVENRKVRPCLFWHQWKWDRRMARGILKCKICGAVKDTRSEEQKQAAQTKGRKKART